MYWTSCRLGGTTTDNGQRTTVRGSVALLKNSISNQHVGMSSAIYILDRDLNLIIYRNYIQDLNVSYIIQSFKTAYQKSHPINLPILENHGITYIYLKKKEVIFMSPVTSDIDIMKSMAFLEKFSQLLQQYFKHYKLIDSQDDVNAIKADLIRDNYILIYELFDECLDFGVPQLTEFSILKDYIKLMIKPEDYHDASHFNEKIDEVEKTVETEINSSISRTAMNKISWRPKGIFYNKNEFFINFNEYLKFKFNHKVHKVIVNQISGEIKCKSYLSGMPNLKLGLNESLNNSSNNSIFNNIQYHQCVDLNLLNDNTVEFIPPDGEFTLLSYQILNTQVLKPLILIKPQYRIFKKNEKFKLRIKVDMVTTFKRKFNMIDLRIRIPLIVKHPILFINFNQSMKFKTKLGNVIHSLDDECIIWSIEKVQGSMRGEMLAEFDLINESDLWKSHLENEKYSKQELNDLYYFEIGSEFSKLGNHEYNIREKLERRRNKSDVMNNDIERVVTVEFQLQNMLYSGLKVDFLSIKEDQLKLQTFPWIMYSVFCKDDDYSFVLGAEEFNNELEDSDETKLLETGRWDAEKNTEFEDVETTATATPVEDFSTALDHADGSIPVDRTNLGFEEYVVEDETV